MAGILHGRVTCSLAATGHRDMNDAIKALLAGADAVQMVSAILPRTVVFAVMTSWRWMESLEPLDWTKCGAAQREEHACAGRVRRPSTFAP